MKHYKIYLIQLLIFIGTNTIAQTSNLTDTLVRNVVPRLGIGCSRNFISEVGLSFVKSKFYNDKDLGFNTAISVFYVSVETMAPFNKPLIMGYKAGREFISIGLVTSAFGLEIAYY